MIASNCLYSTDGPQTATRCLPKSTGIIDQATPPVHIRQSLIFDKAKHLALQSLFL